MKKKDMDKIAYLFVVVGALDWGLIGAFNIDIIQVILGTSPGLVQLIYTLIGLSGLYLLYQMTSKGKK